MYKVRSESQPYELYEYIMLKYGTLTDIERNSAVPEVKIPFIFPVEILNKSHYVVTIQCILTTGRFIVQ